MDVLGSRDLGLSQKTQALCAGLEFLVSRRQSHVQRALMP